MSKIYSLALGASILLVAQPAVLSPRSTPGFRICTVLSRS